MHMKIEEEDNGAQQKVTVAKPSSSSSVEKIMCENCEMKM